MLVAFVSLPLLEMFADYGLTYTRHCRPVKTPGYIVDGLDFSMHHQMDASMGSAFALMSTPFEDGRLSCVPTGFPTMYNSLTCLGCFDCRPDKNNTILHSCSVSKLGMLPNSTYALELKHYGYDFSSIVGMKEIQNGTHSADVFGGYQVSGIVVAKFETCLAIVLAHRNSSTSTGEVSIMFLQFSIPSLCRTLREMAQDAQASQPHGATKRSIPVTVPSPIQTFVAGCTAGGKMSSEDLSVSLKMYRLAMLVSTTDSGLFQKQMSSFDFLTDDYIYRSVLAMKLSNTSTVCGEYSIYTECGAYRWPFAMPYVATCVFLFLVWAFTMCRSEHSLVGEHPYDSATWFREFQCTSMSDADRANS